MTVNVNTVHVFHLHIYLGNQCVACWFNGQGVWLAILRSWIQLPTVLLSDNNLGQVVHIRASVTKQYNLLPVTRQWCHGLASHRPCITD